MLRTVCWAGLISLVSLWSAPLLADEPPLLLVKSTSERMIKALHEDKARIDKEPKYLYELVDKIVLPHFDFLRMSKLVLGKYWRQASVDQQERFVEEFRTLLVRTYATSMREYADQPIEYLPLRMDPGATDVTVKTEVEQLSGFPVPIDYRLYLNDGAWKVFEVSIDGVNLVVNYRSSFATEIRKVGGVEGLIKQLHERNQQALNES